MWMIFRWFGRVMRMMFRNRRLILLFRVRCLWIRFSVSVMLLRGGLGMSLFRVRLWFVLVLVRRRRCGLRWLVRFVRGICLWMMMLCRLVEFVG